MTSYLLSYPGPSWRIVGGGNYQSQNKTPTSPTKALAEWVKLADTLTALGADIAVLPPPVSEHPMSGLVYTANAGHRFGQQFRLAQMTAAHRREESELISNFVDKLGLYAERADHPWEGQAEMIRCGDDRYLLTWGVRSSPESAEEVRSLLPPGVTAFSAQIRPPFSHGDSCFGFFQSPQGKQLLMLYPNALLEKDPSELEAFLGPTVELLTLSEHDAFLSVANTLQFKDTLILPRGASTSLLTKLQQRGFSLIELEFIELFGKGGGGPRSLVNRLGKLPIPDLMQYKNQREQIVKPLR
jgi:N-dimethylarginine dimethylaminohydrolase